jgi:hypothetical protein
LKRRVVVLGTVVLIFSFCVNDNVTAVILYTLAKMDGAYKARNGAKDAPMRRSTNGADAGV